MSFDLVIRNGTLIDGSGQPRYRADVGVSGGRITSIGRISGIGKEEIDAAGHIVSPGFIDGHTHMDAQVLWDNLGSCSCWQGVTTVVMGNCGFTLAPARQNERELVVRNLERAEDISREAMGAGIQWSWETFAEYLDTVEALPKAINYAANIGHSALRTWAMGERAFDEVASDEDMKAMEHELRDAVRAGAIGFTTSRSDGHATSDDRPVASRTADWEEVRQLVNVMGDLGAGVFELAIDPVARSEDPEVRAESYAQMQELAVESRVPFTFGVLPSRDWKSLLNLMDDTAALGGRMFAQSHSRGVSNILSFRSRLPFDTIPGWRDFRALPLDDQLKALKDPATRATLVQAAKEGHYGPTVGAEPRRADYDAMVVLSAAIPPHRTVAEVAAERNIDPVDLIIDLAIETDLNQLFMQPLGSADPDALLAIMKHPRAVMTFSDAGAHVSQIMDSSIQTHLLAYWTRQEQKFTLEEAVRMITLVPALAWGFADRGLVREGMVADLNVFDADTIAPALPTIVSDLPGGAMRLKQGAVGIMATVVAGEVTFRNGEHTGALPGRLLRGPLAHSR